MTFNSALWERLDDGWKVMLTAGDGEEYEATVGEWDVRVCAAGPVVRWVRVNDQSGSGPWLRDELAPAMAVMDDHLELRLRAPEHARQAVRVLLDFGSGAEGELLVVCDDQFTPRMAGIVLTGPIFERTLAVVLEQ
jgi:hypothetical protein